MKTLNLFKILITAYTLAWCLLLNFLKMALVKVGHTLGHIYSDYGGLADLPNITKHFAIPVIGGLHGIIGYSGVTFVTHLVWTLLYGWPIATLLFVWLSKNLNSSRWLFLYSLMGYALYVVSLTVVTAFGLWLPFA